MLVIGHQHRVIDVARIFGKGPFVVGEGRGQHDHPAMRRERRVQFLQE